MVPNEFAVTRRSLEFKKAQSPLFGINFTNFMNIINIQQPTEYLT